MFYSFDFPIFFHHIRGVLTKTFDGSLRNPCSFLWLVRDDIIRGSARDQRALFEEVALFELRTFFGSELLFHVFIARIVLFS